MAQKVFLERTLMGEEGASLEDGFYSYAYRAKVAVSLGDLKNFLEAHKLAIKALEEIAMDISSSPWKETSLEEKKKIFGKKSLYLRPKLVKGLLKRYGVGSETYLNLVRISLGRRRYDPDEEWIYSFKREAEEKLDQDDFSNAESVYRDSAANHSRCGDYERTLIMCNQVVYEAINQLKKLKSLQMEADPSSEDYFEEMRSIKGERERLKDLIDGYQPGGLFREGLLDRASTVSKSRRKN